MSMKKKTTVNYIFLISAAYLEAHLLSLCVSHERRYNMHYGLTEGRHLKNKIESGFSL